ncbi:hypothetical protein [Larkinella soli]|uniref:hypothetical protein n=1 Tax=Larkinella soli TaxID=1770527 RepID=UPI000FFB3D31|nr:hypothetical protein [Larkinella soli]
MSIIRKSGSFPEIPEYDKAFWWSKTPEERLEAALKLILQAKMIYRANPLNPPLTSHGTGILKSHTPIERRRGYLENLPGGTED